MNEPREPSSSDDVLAKFSALPAISVDRQTSERIRRRARAQLARYSRDRREHPVVTWLTRGYFRVEPVLVGALSIVYLVWAFRAVHALFS